MIARSSAWHNRATRSAAGAVPARHFVRGGWGLVCLLAVNAAMAVPPDETAHLLKKADEVKTANHTEFEAIVKALDEQSAQLPAGQQEYLRYLNGYKDAYDGHYDD